MNGPIFSGMAVGMATAKVTITLDEQQLHAIRTLVASGKSKNVSSFIKHAVSIALQDIAGWGAQLAEALEQTGGPLTKAERAWADELLAPVRSKPRTSSKKRRSRSAA